MKKKIYKLIYSIMFILFLSGCNQDIVEKKTEIECPNLSKKNQTIEDIETGKRIEKDLDEYLPNLKPIYIEVLKKYNETENPEKFINIESLGLLTAKNIWPELIKNAENGIEYRNIIKDIKKDNHNWCIAKNIETTKINKKGNL